MTSAKTKRRAAAPRKQCPVCGCDGTESTLRQAQILHGRAGFMAMQALGGNDCGNTLRAALQTMKGTK